MRLPSININAHCLRSSHMCAEATETEKNDNRKETELSGSDADASGFEQLINRLPTQLGSV